MACSLMLGCDVVLIVSLLALHLEQSVSQVSPATKWTVAAAERTYGQWWVTEVKFYTDDACSVEAVDGAPIPFGAFPAFDGDLTRKDAATFKSSCYGCGAGEAWVGLDFGTSVEIRCVRILQSGAKTLALMGAYGEYVMSTNVFEHVPSGVWATLRVPDRRQVFTLANARPTSGAWVVNHVALFSDDACTVPVSSGIVLPSSAVNAFSASETSDEANFQSACEDCPELDAWVSAVFDEPVDIRCVKVKSSGAAALSLVLWDATSGLEQTLRTWDVVPDMLNTLAVSGQRSTYVLFHTGNPGQTYGNPGVRYFSDAGCTQDVSGRSESVPASVRESFDICNSCDESPIFVGHLFSEHAMLQCLHVTSSASVEITVKRLVEPSRTWQDIGSFTLPAGTNVSIPLSSLTVPPNGDFSVATGQSAFEPVTTTTTTTTATSTTTTTSTPTTSTTTTTTTTSSTSTTSTISTVTTTTTTSATWLRALHSTTTTTTQTDTAADIFQAISMRTTSGTESAASPTLAPTSRAPDDDWTASSTTRITTTRPVALMISRSAAPAGSLCAGSSTPGPAYWFIFVLVTSVAIISTCCSLRWQWTYGHVRGRYRMNLGRSKIHDLSDLDLKQDCKDSKDGAESKESKDLRASKMKDKLESTKQDRDSARSDALKYHKEAEEFRAQALRLEYERQALAAELQRFKTVEVEAPSLAVKSLFDEIDLKVRAMGDSAYAEQRTRLKKMKAQYHPDFQRVKNSPELAKIFVQLSQHINRYCDVHLRRDCRECTSTAREIPVDLS